MMRLTRGVKPERYGGIFYSSSDRQPKCELLYVARNEAIGVPLLPLRQPGHGKVKHSDGYLVQVANTASTAHAVLAQNRVDGGNRRFVLVEMEDYADSLTAERVRRVIKGYEFVGSQKEELLR